MMTRTSFRERRPRDVYAEVLRLRRTGYSQEQIAHQFHVTAATVRDYERAGLAVEDAREIAREEIASLCGLVLRRFQGGSGSTEHDEVADTLRSVFGEALRDFGGSPDEPGPKEAA